MNASKPAVRPWRVLACLLWAGCAAAAPNGDGEEVPPAEAAATAQVRTLIERMVRDGAQREGRAQRDAHRKAHGCVRAQFQVNEGLPAALRHGVLREPRAYDALIRYSNGSGRSQDDHDGDGRGMAVKLLGVAGERNLNEPDDERDTQDFVMVNHPVFFVRNAEQYVAFQQALNDDRVMWWVFNPLRFFHEGLIGLSILRHEMANPLDATYFSMVPYRLGPQPIKFRARSCPGSTFASASNTRDRLRENLAVSLDRADACFRFEVQVRTNASTQPIEDPTIEWKEREAPFVPVAQITIPRQVPRLGEACETISYNPWNGLREHQPLGGISRVRRAVYQAISRLRHELNRQRREVPAL